MSDPFLVSKKDVTGMEMYQLDTGIRGIQKSEYPGEQNSTEADFPSYSVFLKISGMPKNTYRSGGSAYRGGILVFSVYCSINEQIAPCGV